MLAEFEIEVLQERLLDWYEKEQRPFPWRNLRNPFAILIAEKLLQQTAARANVVRAFHAILSKYPDPWTLARADKAELELIVAPLGFRYRARELQALAQSIVERHSGAVPLDLRQLLALPGVGDYAARAVLCFAAGEDVPVVDTNIARLLYRVFNLPGPLPANPARKKALIALAESLLPPGRSREFNLALLDLCASCCVSAKPICESCPIRSVCSYGKEAETGRTERVEEPKTTGISPSNSMQ